MLRRLGILMLVSLLPCAMTMADEAAPLQPPDLSSPRATINTFLATSEKHYEVIAEEFWNSPSRGRIAELMRRTAEFEKMFDLSTIPPAARFELARDAQVYLFEVLSRIELPAESSIPDAEGAAAGGNGEAEKPLTSWTIPRTEITLVRVDEGPQAGQYLFNADIVNYQLCRHYLLLTVVGLRYETTADQLRFVLATLRQMLSDHPRVVDADPQVRFAGFGEFSLNVEIRVHVNTVDKREFREIREDIFFRVMKIITDEGSGFAFPRGRCIRRRTMGWIPSDSVMPFPKCGLGRPRSNTLRRITLTTSRASHSMRATN